MQTRSLASSGFHDGPPVDCMPLEALAPLGPVRAGEAQQRSSDGEARQTPYTEWITGEPGPARILVVDDDAVMRELLHMLLSLKGHAIETVSSGDEALQRLGVARRGEAPDFEVVLTDYHMPGLAGADFAEALLAIRPPGMLVIGMSGSSPEPEVIPLYDAFLRKPFHSEEFDDAIRLAAMKHAGQAESAAATATFDRAAPGEGGDAAADLSGVVQESTFEQLAAMLPAAQLRELYRVTLDDVAARHARMVAAAEAGDMKAVGREAHAVKGGCGMVGALELQTLATAAEEGSSFGNVTLDEFPAACLRLRRMLDARLTID